ncbi:MAG: hypothetical protein EZS28_054399, partial [Streblomastix strix]
MSVTANFLVLSINRYLSIQLEIIAAGMMFVIGIVGTMVKGIGGVAKMSNFGLALSLSQGTFNHIGQSIRMTSFLENEMASVEKLKEIYDIEQEEKDYEYKQREKEKEEREEKE